MAFKYAGRFLGDKINFSLMKLTFKRDSPLLTGLPFLNQTEILIRIVEEDILHIEIYSGKFDDDIISLILSIQNNEAKINLPLEEQPDLLDIRLYYQKNGGEFWIALSDGKVIGTIGLMLKEQNCAVMKKFFVKKEFRSQKIGLALYNELLKFAKHAGVQHIILDTPSVAYASHKFYENAGFHKINAQELPISYVYPDRESILYVLDI